MATLNSQQYINIQCTTYKQIQNTILYNKWNHVPPVLSSNDCLMKEPKDFTCLMLHVVGFKIISSRFVLLILSKSLRKAFLKCSFSLQFKNI